MNARMALLAPAALLLASCLPKPGHPIEWLHREDSIIVQLRRDAGPPDDFERLLNIPEFTLYGNGTLLVKGPLEAGGRPLYSTTMAEGDVKGLLEFIDDSGFFNFNYAQPNPDFHSKAQIFLYVALKDRANAVSAYLEASVPNEKAWAAFRKVQEIKQRIDAISASALATPDKRTFEPTAGSLLVQATLATDITGFPEWPYLEIDIGRVTAEGTERRLGSDQLAQLQLEEPSSPRCWRGMQDAGGVYQVCYRPALPFEENFPEFETP